MLKLAIYDSCKEHAMELRNTVKEALVTFKINFQVTTYYSLIDTLLGKITENPYEYDIILFNKEDIKTFEVAKMIRANNLYCAFVFISESEQGIKEAFRYRSSAFLIKPVMKSSLQGVFAYIIDEIKIRQRYFLISNKSTLIRIPFQYIDCFESQLRKVKVIINQDYFNDIVFMRKLDEIHENLPNDNFVRCHQSYIVNLDNVQYLDRVNKKIIMFSGKEIYISKRHYPETMKKFIEYYKDESTVNKFL
jgi:DNA-binding LytR/AlgR family response regulator